VIAVGRDALERMRSRGDPRFRTAVPPGSLLDRLIFGGRDSGDA